MTSRPLFAPDNDAQIDPAIVKQAIVWLVTLQSGTSNEVDKRSCAAWRSANREHERAWQRLATLGQDVRNGGNGVAPPLLRSVLRSTDGNTRRMVLKSLLGFGVISGSVMIAREQPIWHTLAADHHSATGEQRNIVLADGTHVLLNTATAIDVRFDGALRQIILHSGEIMVTTASDPAGRPFEIATANGRIHPIGTRFTVAHDITNRSTATAVAVLEGAVDVTAASGDTAVRVNAGQQTRFTNIAVLPPYALDNALTAWIDGMLVVERMRLTDFIAELGRYRKGILRCEESVADLLVSGSFPLHDVDAVLGLLTETLPVQIRTRTRYWTTVQAAGQT